MRLFPRSSALFAAGIFLAPACAAPDPAEVYSVEVTGGDGGKADSMVGKTLHLEATGVVEIDAMNTGQAAYQGVVSAATLADDEATISGEWLSVRPDRNAMFEIDPGWFSLVSVFVRYREAGTSTWRTVTALGTSESDAGARYNVFGNLKFAQVGVVASTDPLAVSSLPGTFDKDVEYQIFLVPSSAWTALDGDHPYTLSYAIRWRPSS